MLETSMESIAKLLGFIKESIESLRWWSLVAILACIYLKYSPEHYRPFVSSAYLNANDRLELIGLTGVVAAIVFIMGWTAAGLGALSAALRRQRDEIAARRSRIEERKKDRRKRRAEERLRRRRNQYELRNLSVSQLKMVKLALSRPEGILKVSNDAALDIATILATKDVFDRIRPWYNERGGIIGEVFVVMDWVKEIESEVSTSAFDDS